MTVERDAEMISQMGLKLTLMVNTHVHADHITGTGKLKGVVPGACSVLSKASGGQADVQISDGDKVRFGSRRGFGTLVDIKAANVWYRRRALYFPRLRDRFRMVLVTELKPTNLIYHEFLVDRFAASDVATPFLAVELCTNSLVIIRRPLQHVVDGTHPFTSTRA